MEDAYTIRAVERMTGLPQQLIRTWERRYGVVAPGRTPTNRRRYSRRDIEKLRLIREAIEAGNSIGAVADLDIETLRRMALAAAPGPSLPDTPSASSEAMVRQCLDAAQALDAPALDRILARAASDLGPARFASDVAAPLLVRLGEAWRADGLHPAQEHLATEVIRAQVTRLLTANQPDSDAPVAVVATLRGQIHDLGALLVALMATVAGWSVRFLGASLPAEEIAWAARAVNARAVLLSIVYPPDDPRIPAELAELRRTLGDGIPIAVGGRAAPAYGAALEADGMALCTDLEGVRDLLDRLR